MSISEFVESPAYKNVMGKVYGLGAAVVILGALWKILHLPGATAMLIAGLGTDIIEVGRIKDKLLTDEGFMKNIFTSAEIEYCESKKN